VTTNNKIMPMVLKETPGVSSITATHPQDLSSGSGGGGGNNMLEARVAKIESDVEYIKNDIKDIKSDLKELTKNQSEADNKLTYLTTRFDNVLPNLAIKESLVSIETKFDNVLPTLATKENLVRVETKFDNILPTLATKADLASIETKVAKSTCIIILTLLGLLGGSKVFDVFYPYHNVTNSSAPIVKEAAPKK
jgi:uncharacterized coiled-coil protein SlyX